MKGWNVFLQQVIRLSQCTNTCVFPTPVVVSVVSFRRNARAGFKQARISCVTIISPPPGYRLDVCIINRKAFLMNYNFNCGGSVTIPTDQPAGSHRRVASTNVRSAHVQYRLQLPRTSWVLWPIGWPTLSSGWQTSEYTPPPPVWMPNSTVRKYSYSIHVEMLN